ncbi:hypothetical protein PG987_015863 [Apiospora arundinis]
MPKVAAKRSACDRCRAKRVRCPRPEDSTAPCPRCVRAGAPCATGSPGYPGRPRKSHYHVEDDGSTPTDPVVVSGVASSSPVSLSSIIQQQDIGDAGLHTPATNEPPSVNTPTSSWLETDDTDRWVALSETQMFLFPSTAGAHSASAICPSLQWEQSIAQPQPHGRLGAVDSLNMTYSAEDFSNTTFDFNPAICPSSFAYLPRTLPVSRPSAASRLRVFGEKLEQQTSATRAFLLDHRNMVENCPETSLSDEMGTDNPVAAVLTSTKELTEIIQALTAETSLEVPSHTFDSPDQLALSGAPTPPLTKRITAISTENTLLILSSYLALLKLFDELFHKAYLSLSQVPPDTIRSLKAKGVLKIGGISSLQDIPARVYAVGVLETIKGHLQTLERCMGLPPKYCLSCEASASQRSTNNGMFAAGERERLLHMVMAQEDVQRQRGDKPLIELIRENMKGVVTLFGNEDS